MRQGSRMSSEDVTLCMHRVKRISLAIRPVPVPQHAQPQLKSRRSRSAQDALYNTARRSRLLGTRGSRVHHLFLLRPGSRARRTAVGARHTLGAARSVIAGALPLALLVALGWLELVDHPIELRAVRARECVRAPTGHTAERVSRGKMEPHILARSAHATQASAWEGSLTCSR